MSLNFTQTCLYEPCALPDQAGVEQSIYNLDTKLCGKGVLATSFFEIADSVDPGLVVTMHVNRAT